MWSWRARNERSAAASLVAFWETAMSTMLPEEMLGGSRMDGNSIYSRVSAREAGAKASEEREMRTSRLSGVSRTVTPASTLPTVRETSIAGERRSDDSGMEDRARHGGY